MVIIQSGLALELLDSATNLFLTAFEEKFTPILGDKTKAISLFKASIIPANCLSAVEDGKLLGVLAMQTDTQKFMDISYENLKTHYGLVGGIIKAAGLMLLQHHPKPKTMHIEGIAVEDFARGKGVGTKLLDELMAIAVSENFETMTLEVIDTNPRAQKLYERLGFVVQKRSNIWPLNKMIGWGFNESIYMKYKVNGIVK